MSSIYITIIVNISMFIFECLQTDCRLAKVVSRKADLKMYYLHVDLYSLFNAVCITKICDEKPTIGLLLI